jgi:hypothetical protein
MRQIRSYLLATALGLVLLPLTLPIALPSIGAELGLFGTPKGDEGTRVFKAAEHPNYSGQFRLTGQGTVLVGSMRDLPPWDHLDYAGNRLNPVSGRISIEVDERANTGRVLVDFAEGTDRYRIVFDRFGGTAPYQDGGIATRVYEHGDSGNGDPLYPKTWLYLAGWGKADVFKNGDLLLKDYAAHFMVMERSRDPKTHGVHYPMKRSLPGGETDPAGMEIAETFIHLYWEEVTWRQ